jgi:hypothetical protein
MQLDQRSYQRHRDTRAWRGKITKLAANVSTPARCVTRVEGGMRLTLDPVTKYWVTTPL